MSFPPNTDFCCLALAGPNLAAERDEAVLPGLTVSSSTTHVQLDDIWERWLGTLQTESFKKSSLVIIAEQNSFHATASEPAPGRLERRVRLFHYALILGGCGYNSSTLMVAGNTSGGSLHIGPISVGLTPCYHPQYRKYKPITIDELRRAATALASLEHIYDYTPNPDYRRIRKGFNSWIQGVESADQTPGLHSFVRAAEAIIRPTTTTWTRRKITATFVTRGQTLTGRFKQNERLLGQLYDLRSCIEHVKNVSPIVQKPRGESRGEAFAFRALQAEIFASAIYSRIFATDALREQLRTERRVEGFWRRADASRRALWGEIIDVSATARREFTPTDTPDML